VLNLLKEKLPREVKPSDEEMIEEKKAPVTKMEDHDYCKPKDTTPKSHEAFDECFQGIGSSISEMKCCGKRQVNREGFMILSIPIKPAEFPRHVDGTKTSIRLFIQRKGWINIFSKYFVQLTADEKLTVHGFKVFVCKKLGFDWLRFRMFKYDGKGPSHPVREKEELLRSFDGRELILFEDFVLAGFEVPLSSEQHEERIENGSYSLAYFYFRDCPKLGSYKPVFVDSTELLSPNFWTAAYQLFEESGNTLSRYFNFNDYVESPEYDFSIKLVANKESKRLDYIAEDPITVPASTAIEIDVRNDSMRRTSFVRDITFFSEVELQLDEVINPTPLQQIIMELYSPEHIEDYTCEACKVKTVFVKQEKLKHMPTYLIIHLNTVQMDLRYGEMLKTDRFIDIPLEGLDLTAAADLEPGETVPPFELVGVIHHTGSHSEGHYTATCRSSDRHLWHHFDDQKTSEVSASGLALTSAYMLIYKKVSQPPTKE